MKYSYTIFIICIILNLSSQQAPQQPVIGIYTQDVEDFNSSGTIPPNTTYIAASYVKNL
jgi:hypothetical protein